VYKCACTQYDNNMNANENATPAAKITYTVERDLGWYFNDAVETKIFFDRMSAFDHARRFENARIVRRSPASPAGTMIAFTNGFRDLRMV
jgi:hypothetical protein